MRGHHDSTTINEAKMTQGVTVEQDTPAHGLGSEDNRIGVPMPPAQERGVREDVIATHAKELAGMIGPDEGWGMWRDWLSMFAARIDASAKAAVGGDSA